MIRAFRWFSGRVEAWTRRPELRRRCAWLHHGPNPHGSTEYKLVARRAAPDGELPSDRRAPSRGQPASVETLTQEGVWHPHLELDTKSPIQAEDEFVASSRDAGAGYRSECRSTSPRKSCRPSSMSLLERSTPHPSPRHCPRLTHRSTMGADNAVRPAEAPDVLPAT